MAKEYTKEQLIEIGNSHIYVSNLLRDLDEIEEVKHYELKYKVGVKLKKTIDEYRTIPECFQKELDEKLGLEERIKENKKFMIG